MNSFLFDRLSLSVRCVQNDEDFGIAQIWWSAFINQWIYDFWSAWYWHWSYDWSWHWPSNWAGHWAGDWPINWPSHYVPTFYTIRATVTGPSFEFGSYYLTAFQLTHTINRGTLTVSGNLTVTREGME